MELRSNRILRLVAVFLLIAAMVLTLACCGKKDDAKDQNDSTAPVETEEREEISLTIRVIDPEGKTETHFIKTTAKTLADALLESGLVEGEDTEYGLFITTVDGIKAEDGYWWSIASDGVLLDTGASSVIISDKDHYELEYTKY